MSYLETEIDETLKNLCIENIKLDPIELNALIASLCRTFFGDGSSSLDPIELRAKHTEHNPNFWREVSKRIQYDQLILIVFDNAYRAWEIGSPDQLQHILFETTGYPFWVTDIDFSFLVYVDDHDCVNWA